MLRTTQQINSGKIEIKEAEFLSSGSGETIIEVQNAGVSGTELDLLQDDYPVPLPHVCGHEFTRRVKSVGDGIDKKWVGKTVTTEINNTFLAYGKKLYIPPAKKRRTFTSSNKNRNRNYKSCEGF